jgi:uncharacterized RDD family membrane protein YckC
MKNKIIMQRVLFSGIRRWRGLRGLATSSGQDIVNRRVVYKDPATDDLYKEDYDEEQKKLFYYNVETMDTIDSIPLNYERIETGMVDQGIDDIMTKKPNEYTLEEKRLMFHKKVEYATDWQHDDYPEYCEFLEIHSKRPYYYNRLTNDVTWAPPNDPERDIFFQEIQEYNKPLKRVENIENASFIKRAAATVIDIGACAGGGMLFGLGVYIEMDQIPVALPAVGFSSWILFVMRDMVFERGTRSLGKRLMKLEIVTKDGQLPNRWNTLFRNINIMPYAISVLLMPYFSLYVLLDLGPMILTDRQRRLGDFIGNTMVIVEQEDRKERLEEKFTRMDEDEMKD